MKSLQFQKGFVKVWKHVEVLENKKQQATHPSTRVFLTLSLVFSHFIASMIDPGGVSLQSFFLSLLFLLVHLFVYLLCNTFYQPTLTFLLLHLNMKSCTMVDPSPRL